MQSMGFKIRVKAIETVNTREPRKCPLPVDENGQLLKVSEYFGMSTFSKKQMLDKLPKDIYKKLISTIERGHSIDHDTANAVAHAVKEWALERGVTHFCHWFQPQTGATAEKHDAFLTFEDNQEPMERFSGSQLIQSEPDASSFPSGGMRTTFEARGYTAWDPSSPMFIMQSTNGKTLCIPSVFISYHGAALDEKTPLLRSSDVLSKKTMELLHLIGVKDVERVVTTMGPEQEYFLIDKAYYSARPDLVMAGRTLIGAQPQKGQQLEDHYFGSITNRVQAFMNEFEVELYKLGVPIKTRHNEVAPSQYESAPIFEEVHIASDHNQLVMEMLRKIAKRHKFEVLLHEKPFAGVNGSGKHCNWSLMLQSEKSELNGSNLLEPGKTPHENVRFLLCLAAVLKGVHEHAGLLRAGIASPGNDHRLGANEAPPAIISVFLGDTLSSIVDQLSAGKAYAGKTAEEALLQLGVNKLPNIMKDNTDRNRTSPFAFTGNKFEFRAVGGSTNIAFPVSLLNAAVADGMTKVLEVLKKHNVTSIHTLDAGIISALSEVFSETKAVCFEGNNYSEEWVLEAEKRGLPHLRKTPESLAQIVSTKSKALLSGLGVLSEAEIVSRYNIRVESYIKKLMIEAETLVYMVKTMVMPAAYSYHSFLSKGASFAKSAGVSAPQLEDINKINAFLTDLKNKESTLSAELKKCHSLTDHEKVAECLANEVSVLMLEVREICDQIEENIADEFWPLPKYREILFLA